MDFKTFHLKERKEAFRFLDLGTRVLFFFLGGLNQEILMRQSTINFLKIIMHFFYSLYRTLVLQAFNVICVQGWMGGMHIYL